MNFIHLFEKEKLIRYRKDYAVGAYVRLRKKEAKGWSQVEGKITYANNSYFVVKTENYQYGVEENILLPEFSEVLAWMPIPKMWKGERSCK